MYDSWEADTVILHACHLLWYCINAVFIWDWQIFYISAVMHNSIYCISLIIRLIILDNRISKKNNRHENPFCIIMISFLYRKEIMMMQNGFSWLTNKFKCLILFVVLWSISSMAWSPHDAVNNLAWPPTCCMSEGHFPCRKIFSLLFVPSQCYVSLNIVMMGWKTYRI